MPEKRPADESIEVLDREAYFLRSKAARRRTNPDDQLIFAMYSSLVDGIVTDPELMTVPLDDHGFIRGHAVFDTATLVKGCVYRLGIHLDRLFESARSGRLKLPFGESEEDNRRRITDIVCRTCVASGRQDGSIRFWLTAGPGNFGFTTSGCEAAFYCIVFGGLPAGLSDKAAIAEATVRTSKVPMKPPLLAQMKSNNYLLNCLTAMEAQSNGGRFGIIVRDDDTIAEACVLNVLVVTEAGEMITPPFAGILAGTSMRKALELARTHLLGDGGLLTEVRQEVLPLARLRAAKEVAVVAGETHLIAIGSLDGQQIGTGEVGPVVTKLVELLEQAANDCGSAEHIKLQY